MKTHGGTRQPRHPLPHGSALLDRWRRRFLEASIQRELWDEEKSDFTLEHPEPQEAAPPMDWPRHLGRAVGSSLVVISLALGGYLWIGHHTDPARARVLATPIDLALPFLPWTVFFYAWAYTFMVYPLFTVRCPRLHWRVVGAYVALLTVSLTCFRFIPVTAVGLRPESASLDTASFAGWILAINYALDPPFNLFPSMHVSAAVAAAMSAWQARRSWGLLGLGIALAISLSTLTVKQHYLADVVAGAILGIIVWAVILAPYARKRAPLALRAFGWRGPALYLLANLAAFGVAWLVFSFGGAA